MRVRTVFRLIVSEEARRIHAPTFANMRRMLHNRLSNINPIGDYHENMEHYPTSYGLVSVTPELFDTLAECRDKIERWDSPQKHYPALAHMYGHDMQYDHGHLPTAIDIVSLIDSGVITADNYKDTAFTGTKIMTILDIRCPPDYREWHKIYRRHIRKMALKELHDISTEVDTRHIQRFNDLVSRIQADIENPNTQIDVDMETYYDDILDLHVRLSYHNARFEYNLHCGVSPYEDLNKAAMGILAIIGA